MAEKSCIDCGIELESDSTQCADCGRITELRKEIAEKEQEIGRLEKKINEHFACPLCEEYNEFVSQEYLAGDGKTHIDCILKQEKVVK